MSGGSVGSDQVVELVRRVLTEAMIIAAPLLIVTCVVSLAISLLQTLTSIQEQTLTAVPRLVVVFGVTMVALPWMVHRLVNFTMRLFSDFHKYLG
jgi:flagellar biosynthetic protein FliQ